MARRPLSKIREANEIARVALSAAHAQPRANTDHLGDLAWWDPSPGWREDVSRVEDVFRAHGIDPAGTLPAAPDWALAFGRAVASLRVAMRHRNYQLIDAAAGPNGERRVGVVHIARNSEVTTKDEGTIACPKQGMPYVERPDAHGIGDEVLAVARGFFNRYTVDDVRAAIVTTFTRWAAMPCRQAPPHMIYWIPAGGAAAIRGLADAVEELGWGRLELFAGYASDPRSARACVNAVNGGLEAQLKDFAEEAERFANTDASRTRVSTLEAKLADAQRLRQQGLLYREILGAAVASVDDRVAAVEQSLRATLGLVEAAHAA